MKKKKKPFCFLINWTFFFIWIKIKLGYKEASCYIYLNKCDKYFILTFIIIIIIIGNLISREPNLSYLIELCFEKKIKFFKILINVFLITRFMCMCVCYEGIWESVRLDLNSQSQCIIEKFEFRLTLPSRFIWFYLHTYLSVM